jgi:hypothetical protein
MKKEGEDASDPPRTGRAAADDRRAITTGGAVRQPVTMRIFSDYV